MSVSAAQAHIRKWLLCSPEEWSNRTSALGDSMAFLVNQYASERLGRGLDVGCQNGALSNLLAQQTRLTWWGVDPIIVSPQRVCATGVELLPGTADEIPFPDRHFDCVVLANVFEHLLPERRLTSIAEIGRVLRPGGALVGQLPNPHFPVESHSRLPFMGWLPASARAHYWRLAPVPWRDDYFPENIPFYVVTIKDLRRCADAAGFTTELVRNFHYPAQALPSSLRWSAQLFERTPLRRMPWAWQFVFRKR